MKPTNSLRVLGKIGNVVYQRVKPGLGNVPGDPTRTLQVRAYVLPLAPATPAQLARRARMQAAVAEWHTLSPSEKAAFQPDATKRRITAFNAFCSWRIKNPAALGITIWDNGLTTWDNGLTVWDAYTGTIWDGGATTWDNGTTLWDAITGTAWDGGATLWDGGATLWDANTGTAWDNGLTSWDNGLTTWDT